MIFIFCFCSDKTADTCRAAIATKEGQNTKMSNFERDGSSVKCMSRLKENHFLKMLMKTSGKYWPRINGIYFCFHVGVQRKQICQRPIFTFFCLLIIFWDGSITFEDKTLTSSRIIKRLRFSLGEDTRYQSRVRGNQKILVFKSRNVIWSRKFQGINFYRLKSAGVFIIENLFSSDKRNVFP